ncbi:Cysteine proteinase [Glarea lozoyensis ATCC 20868]|uniref:Ubiquitin carboxyl-terminal hydrolase n=2 Tax=Glarea lozoyensis TaxID=101852 RepID=S3CMF9_GLAL2|nr:Cysteine proteinase [Glarea lozoyensis ATCC 20868]EHL01028.1 putative Ubiquitin carboxyl-terminal hydrolase 6 [Glarea lozoyensis 74030]EPE26394.1 Cysteine proteinase [Glarea lozoyensis ATCC 20868]
MATIPVVIKHQGKKHNVDLDPSTNGEVFKLQVYSVTNVEPDRQKILVKGGQLKDDMELSKLNAKPGQEFMMIGTPRSGATALSRPKEAIKFVEDMTEAEAAQQVGAIPAGLTNLGNTCYLNSALQTLRTIPELQEELVKYGRPGSGASADTTAALRDLYKYMGETQEHFAPHVFLLALRAENQQFAQRAKNGHGYAQQDAEEAWSHIITQLKQKLLLQKSDPNSSESSESNALSFVDRYMTGRTTIVTKQDEGAADQEGETTQEIFLKLNCNIKGTTNHLRDGLKDAGVANIEMRGGHYTRTSHISRLPKYLTVHFVRFGWKERAGDSGIKTKIMRKVTFPHELDMVEFCTDELRAKLVPVRDKVREVRKDEEDIERARKRQKKIRDKEAADAAAGIVDSVSASKNESDKKPVDKKDSKKKDGKTADGDTEMEDVVYKTDAEIDAEKAAALLEAKKELHSLISQDLLDDEGSNKSGLYELRGVVTHKGASADSGHYTSFVKKQGPLDPKTGRRGEEDGKWWWFDDDKVSEVEADTIATLSGGGESHSALILLYRAIPLPSADGTSDL